MEDPKKKMLREVSHDRLTPKKRDDLVQSEIFGDFEEDEGDGDQIDMDYQKTQPDQLTIEELHQQLQHAEPKVETADSLAKGIESLIEQGGVENFYIEIPKIDLG